MKGKSNFTNDELILLRLIIKKYENSDSRLERKQLRSKLRSLGFYMSDYGIRNITLNEFDNLFKINKVIKTAKKTYKKRIENNKVSINKFLEKFVAFDPLINNPNVIPDNKGNYLILLKPNKKLPPVKNKYITKKFRNKEVIYTGISNKSLRNRDFKQHFNGTAGNSTLRKSIGSLMGLKKIPRDKIDNGKTKFNDEDERKLSIWMKENLELHYLENENPNKIEQFLIDYFNPPLNLSKNNNKVNYEFRKELLQLRRKR